MPTPILKTLKSDKVIIAPSLLAADFSNLQKDIKKTIDAGIKILHIDVMDGHFVPNLSIGQPIINGIRNVSNQIFDTHLMITNPLQYIKSFAESGSDHITFHVESDDDITTVIKEIKKYSMSVGLSVKPKTDPDTILPYINDLDLILVMTVEPGFGGQSFMKEMMPKVHYLKDKIRETEKDIFLQVDGGIDENNINIASDAGANVMVAGTSVFRHKNGVRSAVNALLVN
ncbi:MAG TPA: ribulose-phosphate 3-epimerase [Victivallales bacterium]|nr:ribulose-phosphate 3-epimerase [Victivallales bacterium]